MRPSEDQRILMGAGSGEAERRLDPIALAPMPDSPLFSVLIANFNYGKYLGEALDSLLAQTYGNFEAVVCDDGSTDDSRDLVQRYAERDTRIKLVAKENGGVASALNMAYARSTGELIAILDADDVFMPSKLERVLSAFRGNSQAGLCVHPVIPVSASGRQLAPPAPDPIRGGWVGPVALKRGGFSSFPPASGLTFRREAISALFPLPLHVRRGLDYFLCQTGQFYTLVTAVPEPLALYRIHGANITGSAMPNASACRRSVEDLETLLPLQRDFLSRHYGSKIACALRLEDNPGYWECLLTICVLDGQRGEDFRGFTARQMIRRILQRRRRQIWRALTLMPTPLARRTFYLWLRLSHVKRGIRSVSVWLARATGRVGAGGSQA